MEAYQLDKRPKGKRAIENPQRVPGGESGPPVFNFVVSLQEEKAS